jgi:hypothetical protein
VSIYTLFHPPVFQGRKKKRSYFEGWYFKMAKDDEVLAIIVGIALDSHGIDRHAFIQVFSSIDHNRWYVTYPIEQFSADRQQFDITIGPNHFSTHEISVTIDQDDLQLSGSVSHHGIQPFPVTVASPGIMGWYAYVPFMECFHGVVSMHHSLQGSLRLNERNINWSDGIGYIEKDWGQSFPTAWIWMQSNLFSTKGVSCMLSIAEIPFLGRTFTGFLGFVHLPDGLIRFGTYTKATIKTLTCDEQRATITVQNNQYLITFDAKMGPSTHLAAPRQGKMERTIHESIMGTITLTVQHIGTQKILFQETGYAAGLELSEADFAPMG